MKYPTLLLLCLLFACDVLPRDPGGTSQRIAEQGTFTVGAVEAGLPQDEDVKH